MKQSDPIINEMVKSIDYNWDMCNVDLNFITSRLEERSTKEVDYKVLKKLFSFLEDKTRHIEVLVEEVIPDIELTVPLNITLSIHADPVHRTRA